MRATSAVAGPPATGRAGPSWREPGRLVALTVSWCGALVALAVLVGPVFLPYRAYFVRSPSMAPGIPTGALVVLRPVDAERVAVGDVVAFDQPGAPGARVIHRVAAAQDTSRGRTFVTRGDANPAPDPWRVPAAGRQWRHQATVPWLGYAVSALATPFGALALLASVAGALVLRPPQGSLRRYGPTSARRVSLRARTRTTLLTALR